MTDFAPNYTFRYKVRYMCALRTHVTTFRWDALAAAFNISELLEDVGDWFDALIPILANDFALLDATAAARHDDTFLPNPLPPITVAVNPLNVPLKGNSPRFLSFAAKSALGNTTRNYIYGVTSATHTELQADGNDYRFLQGEDATVDAAILAYSNIRNLVASDNEPAQFVYPYANAGLNSYYQRKARTS